MSRRSLFVSLGILLACAALAGGCKKKKVDDAGGGGGGSDSGPGGGGAAVSTDLIVFARVDAKSVRDGALFAEVKQAVTKGGATAEWDKADADAGKEFGAKITDIDTVTVAMTELPERGEPKVVLILTSKVPFQKAGAFGLKADAKPDSRGFYKSQGFTLIHFPDDKTAVAVSPELADKYLGGYAKDRAGWPLSGDLTRAAAGHTVFATVNLQKLTASAPAEMKQQVGALASAKSVTLIADLKGKELTATLRGTFPDAATAGNAKAKVQEFVDMAGGVVNQFAGGKGPPEAAEFLPAIKQAQQTLKGLKVEVSGADVIATASYKAEGDIGQMIADAVKKVGAAAGRMKADNNLKQIGLGLHSIHDVMGRAPVSGVGANAALLKNATEKPLLSWRVAILPYIEQEALYKEFKLNEPWDSEHNKKLIAKMPAIFASVEKPGQPGYTHLQMVVGPGALQPPSIALAAIPDGTSNTVAVIEAVNPVIWTKPDDVTLPAKLAPGALKAKFGGQYPGGFHVVMWDGSTRFVKDTVSERTLANALNPSDGMVLGSDW